jgi:hypothetical protein
MNRKRKNAIETEEEKPNNDEHIINNNVGDLPLDLLANHIFPFVGGDQYRFVGSVCQSFEKAYGTSFPMKTTSYNLSTLKHAKICFEEAPLKDRPLLKRLARKQSWYYYVRYDSTNDEDLALLEWARSNGCSWNERTCYFAAQNGHLEVLQWARSNGCSWNRDTCSEAAHNGHLEVLQWARSNGCSWNERTCSAAAHNGHLEVLQWARANGCPWYANTCTEAAENGHLEVLQWARANGCPWDE